ncbi:hypothetical protein BDK51DRAFT_45165 [Blyttiomyces helicus]|uniref:Uncharacterized protein n=1 Tax=Blyttiomyces helicus TaxID=388810 RepID=A0A4P9W639_9FUNG|nr:hypothetical protein BDK51DRAFT_45165 [Blyttiomyces helicus]|eukprot:RKO87911.1 hypothetical protein BDK51DRAFT_45165 [Blyttiomyces helicus]
MLFIIVVSGAILFMALVGMIKWQNDDIKKQWIEDSSQVLNACFTLNALLLAPGRTLTLHRTIQLARARGWRTGPSEGWTADAIKRARVLEADNKPWLHLVPTRPSGAVIPDYEITPWRKWVAITLYNNANGWFQIPMAVAMYVWINDFNNRPPYIVGASLPLSFICGAIAGIWPSLIWKKVKKIRKERKAAAGGEDAGGPIPSDGIPLTEGSASKTLSVGGASTGAEDTNTVDTQTPVKTPTPIDTHEELEGGSRGPIFQEGGERGRTRGSLKEEKWTRSLTRKVLFGGEKEEEE